MNLNLSIFREYDIRGIADTDLHNEFVELLGPAIVAYAKSKYQVDLKTVAIGNDMRLSATRLRDALTRGFNNAGVDVLHLGLVPTAAVYFASYELDVQAVVQITGSHNPSDYNGFKMMIGEETLHGQAIQELRKLIVSGDVPKSETPGKCEKYPSILDDYMRWIEENIDLGPRKLKLVVDCGNGAGGVMAEELIVNRLKQDAVMLYTDPDGNFPNHHPDPTVPENLVDLVAKVKETGADVGVAYDGDADRIGICDENGKILFGDTLLLLLGREVLKHHPGATIIGEVKCSQKLFDDIEAHGGKPIMAQCGHSLIKAKIRETDAKLGGEVSGHIFFNDKFFGFDDGLYATARLVEILSHTDKSVSELLSDVPTTYVTPEIRTDVDESIKFEIPERVAKIYADQGFETNTIDGVRVNFGDGWALCRASNTQAALVLRVEADSEARRDALFAELEENVKKASKQ